MQPKMILEWCMGVAMLTTAGFLYNKRTAPVSDWERFEVVCQALPTELWDRFREESTPGERALLEQARVSQARLNKRQALAEFLAPLVGVSSKRIADAEQAFRDFLPSHGDRVLAALKKQVQAWSDCWFQLDGKSRAAVLLMTLPPELSAQLFQLLGVEEVQSITLAIAKLPPIPTGTRRLIVQQFLGLERPDGHLEQKLSALAARDPHLLVSMLRAL